MCCRLRKYFDFPVTLTIIMWPRMVKWHHMSVTSYVCRYLMRWTPAVRFRCAGMTSLACEHSSFDELFYFTLAFWGHRRVFLFFFYYFHFLSNDIFRLLCHSFVIQYTLPLDLWMDMSSIQTSMTLPKSEPQIRILFESGKFSKVPISADCQIMHDNSITYSYNWIS